ncbi:MAG: hypothetical protein R3Y58_03290 [Eubacteriales bacterium]
MKEIYAWRNKVAEIYSENTRVIDIAARFVLGLIVFSYINRNIGFMESLDSFIVILGLSVVCSFVPLTCMIIIASFIMLLHIYAASLVLAGCAAVVVVVLYIFYFRFSPKQSIAFLMTPLALGLHVPYVLPIACGLLLGPVAAVATSCGVVAYYMIDIIGEMSGTLSGDGIDGMLEDAISFAEQLIKCEEMMVYIIVIMVTLCAVTALKHLAIEHAWKIAVGTGCIVSLITVIIVGSVLGAEFSLFGALLGNVLAILVGLGLEIVFMNVDFKKAETLEFEDDDYHYYVKAVPKIRTKSKVAESSEFEDVEDFDEIQSYEEEDEVDSLDEFNDIEGFDMNANYVGSRNNETMVINSANVERELRNHARTNDRNRSQNKNRHMETNYQMLHDSIKKDR